MKKAGKIVVWTVPAVLLVAVAATAIWFYLRPRPPVTLKGAVTIQSSDPNKELPIADVEITAANGNHLSAARSDSSGYFSITLSKGVRRGEPVAFKFRRAGYEPLDLHEFVGDKLYVVHLTPLPSETRADANQPATTVGNIRIRYSIKDMLAVNIGSAVKTFQVTNTGNVPCKGHHPCSPDGKWKAAIASSSLDAGTGNQFRNARVSCIAGPCPFTRIESDGFTQGGRIISVAARDWSDTATFLVEAEVFHPMVSQIGHDLYPVIFGRTLNFTLPSTAEGVSIEADIEGKNIFFPLGPALFLSWANCNARVNPDQTRVYRCELKPGYKF